MEKQYFVRLPLENAYNARDLGGYPAENGKVTRWHEFVRTDDLHSLDERDIQFLRDYGVKAVLDLRSGDELERRPNRLAARDGFVYKNISLMGEGVSDATLTVPEDPAEFLPMFYLGMLKNSHREIKEMFDFFAENVGGGILFHCAAGKDRTGITAMLLLGLCGVRKWDILANYEVTHSHLRANAPMMAQAKNYPAEVMYSRAEYIERSVDYILGECGGFERYLLSCGIDASVLERVKRKLAGE